MSMTTIEKTTAIHPLLEKRWSPRAFADRPVAPAVLASLLEAARWAPSSRNAQPWRFIVATKDDPDEYQRLFATIMEGNQRWAGRAPVLMLGVAKLNLERNDQPNRHAEYDLGQAVAQLAVQATAHNLYVHQMGGFSRSKARAAYNIPAGYEPVVALAIGYKAAPETLPDDLRQRELSTRTRRPLEELVFAGAWGRPAEILREPEIEKLHLPFMTAPRATL